MRTGVGVIVRFVLYVVLIAIAFVVARAEWSALGIDALTAGSDEAVARIARWHDRLPVALPFATFVIALVGEASRMLALFLLWVLIGAILTAPIAIAHATAS
ncbi:MAG: hypothetical protein JO060_09755 [Candidatus Eremiobacteraeota bacterium]|nr:hypothetical protein [Candidatus Eremiobacteraeota bacterium]MBV9647901.1 hypothetical protein [Candidatus Eremiobacteraeota bacterium]